MVLDDYSNASPEVLNRVRALSNKPVPQIRSDVRDAGVLDRVDSEKNGCSIVPRSSFGLASKKSHTKEIAHRAAMCHLPCPFDLPFITQVVLAELTAHLKQDGPPISVPFFANDDELHMVHRLGGASLR